MPNLYPCTPVRGNLGLERSAGSRKRERMFKGPDKCIRQRSQTLSNSGVNLNASTANTYW